MVFETRIWHSDDLGPTSPVTHDINSRQCASFIVAYCVAYVVAMSTGALSLSFPSLSRQNGGMPEMPEEEDPVKRYIRNSRDMSKLVTSDTVNT